MSLRLSTVSPAPRLRPRNGPEALSYAHVEAGLAACGVSLAGVRGSDGAVRVSVPDTGRAAEELFAAVLTDSSARQMRAFRGAFREAVSEHVTQALADRVAEGWAAASERTQALASAMGPVWSRLFLAFCENPPPPSGSVVVVPQPGTSGLASDGLAAWSAMRRAPFADVMVFLAESRAAAYARHFEREAEERQRRLGIGRAP